MSIALEYFVPGNPTFVPGATAPTAQQASRVSEVAATVTGDGAATSFVLTHNFGMSTADLANGLPEVQFEPLLAAAWTEEPHVTVKGANSITVVVVGAAATAFMNVRVKRPNTIDR